MSDQSDRKPGDKNDIPIIYNDPFDAVRQDPESFDFFVANNGVKFHHWACIPDPIGEVEIGDARESYTADNPQFEEGNKFYKENGFIYFYRGEVIGIFQGNTNKLNNVYAGFYTSSGASLTLNRYYRGTKNVVSMSEFDKLIPCEIDSEINSVNWEKFVFNSNGINRTQFFITSVELLVDSDGQVYHHGVDYVVFNGNVKWLQGGNWPGIDPRTGNGKVCAIRYTYKPYFYVKQFFHDIRVRPEIDYTTGEVRIRSGNISCQVVADFIYLDSKTRDDKDRIQQIMHGYGSNQGPK